MNPEREFFLLAVLGADLSGAIVIAPLEGDAKADDARDADRDDYRPRDTVLRFSFAGVQLKFSAVMEASGGLRVPSGGMGGSWIVKLPSVRFTAVPENVSIFIIRRWRSPLHCERRALLATSSNRLQPEEAQVQSRCERGLRQLTRLQPA